MWHTSDSGHNKTMHCNGQVWYWRLVCRIVESVFRRLFQFNANSCYSLHQKRVWFAIWKAFILITCMPFIDFRNIVDDINCVSDLKPVGVQKCNISQVSECGPSWHYSDWSDVSVLNFYLLFFIVNYVCPFQILLFAVFQGLWYRNPKTNNKMFKLWAKRRWNERIRKLQT